MTTEQEINIMLTYDYLIKELKEIFDEYYNKHHTEFVLDYDLNRWIEEKITNSETELSRAYTDGKNAGDDERYDDGYDDGYDEGKYNALHYVKEKVNGAWEEFKDKLDKVLSDV